MLFELALLSVAIPAGYWGVVYLRRRPFGTATFGTMLLATTAAAVLSLASRRAGAGDLDVLGAIAIGAGVCLLLVGPLLRSAARWAINSEHLALASFLIDARDLLQPGTGAREEKALVDALRDVRAGRVDDAVDALRSVRPQAAPAARRQIDERIALLYLSASRFRDAVDHVERTLLTDRGEAPATEDVGASEEPPDAAAPEAPPGAVHPGLRDLPISVGLYAELVGAYGRLGDLDRAAAIADDLDRRATGVTELVFLVHRVRLVYLAFAGRVGAVDRLLAPVTASHMTAAARRYWAGVARERAGDREGARIAYQDAHDRAGREPRARDVVARALDGLDAAPAAALSPGATAIADRLGTAGLSMPAPRRARRRWVTLALVGVNLAVAAAVAIALGGPGDVGAVIRAGAMLHGAVEAGELWRLPASTFVHIGVAHLVVNVLGLWILGRHAESLLGSARLLAIYLAAGFGGAVASYLFSGAGVSAGASGAICGLLGAVLVELLAHRRHYRREWRRGMVSVLTFAILADVALGVLFRIVDNWAHLGGLATGGAVVLLVSPHARWPRLAVAATRVLAAAGVAMAAWAGVRAATTGFDATLDRSPAVLRTLSGVTVTAPASWEPEDGRLVDRDFLLALEVRGTGAPCEGGWDAEQGRAEARLRTDGLGDVARARDVRVPLPPGWTGIELVASGTDPLGTTQRYRVVLFRRDLVGGCALGSLHLPEALAASGAPALARTIASIRPGAPGAP